MNTNNPPFYKKQMLISRFQIALTIALLAQSVLIRAESVSVTNTLDDGSTGSFRSAITSANTSAGVSEIVFDSGLSGTITLTSDLPGITDDLTITGPGASVLAISGDNTYAMFSVSSGKTLTLSGLTFTENKSGNGSGSGWTI